MKTSKTIQSESLTIRQQTNYERKSPKCLRSKSPQEVGI